MAELSVTTNPHRVRGPCRSSVGQSPWHDLCPQSAQSGVTLGKDAGSTPGTGGGGGAHRSHLLKKIPRCSFPLFFWLFCAFDQKKCLWTIRKFVFSIHFFFISCGFKEIINFMCLRLLVPKKHSNPYRIKNVLPVLYVIRRIKIQIQIY